MSRTHYLFTTLSIVVGILFAIGLTFLVGHLGEISAKRDIGTLPPPPVKDEIVPASEPARLSQVDTPSSSLPGSELVEPFFVRAQGARGPLVVYEMANGQERFRLPAGMPSADWNYYYAATPQQDETLVELFEPETGQLQRSFTLAGLWGLSAVSPSGRWLVLTGLAAKDEAARRQTNIQIIEADSGQVSHTVQFEGNFEVETISNRGDSLFLIEHLPAENPAHYLVRLYDVAAAQLLPDALRAKTATEEVMTGLAWGGLASPDGQWLLTLYLNTQRDVAFIHTLNLENKFPFCIDLPSGDGELDQLKAYSLALSPDGQTVYAANTALGVVAEVNLESLSVTRQAKFPANVPLSSGTGSETGPTNYSAVTKDGRSLYFTGGWDVWRYDTVSGEVEGPYWQGEAIQGLALSQNEQQLYLAIEGKTPLVIDLAEEVVLNFSSKE